MDYAKNLLVKYGWNEGEGLGKNNNGITKPLKASLKFDKAGLGVDKADEFNNHWWERVFNDASSNIDVGTKGGRVKIDVKDKNSIEITTNSYSVKNLKKTAGENGYKHFIKKSVLSGLTETNETPDDSEPEEPDLPKYKALTDEELFAACGGRTAHKGARHGLKLTGKLNRIEEQERELLAKLQADRSVAEAWTAVSSKKKRKRMEPAGEVVAANCEDSIMQTDLYVNEYHIKSKKKKKKNKKEDVELSSALDAAIATSAEHVEPKNEENEEVTINSADFEKPPKKKKKKRTKDSQENIPLSKDNFLRSPESEGLSTTGKKKKKDKRRQHQEFI